MYRIRAFIWRVNKGQVFSWTTTAAAVSRSEHELESTSLRAIVHDADVQSGSINSSRQQEEKAAEGRLENHHGMHGLCWRVFARAVMLLELVGVRRFRYPRPVMQLQQPAGLAFPLAQHLVHAACSWPFAWIM